MDKKQLTLDDIRQAIYDFDLPYTEVGDDVRKMSDEAFAQCDFEEDFGMDSMDIVEVTMYLERNCAISLPDTAIEHVISRNTVASMLEHYNQCLSA